MGMAGADTTPLVTTQVTGACNRIRWRDRVSTGLSSRTGLIIIRKQFKPRKAWEPIGFSCSHLDIFQQQSFNILADPRPGTAMDIQQ